MGLRIPPFRLVPEPLDDEAKSLPGFKWAGKGVGKRHRLGGNPEFIQETNSPACPDCGEQMTFYAQLDSINDQYCIALLAEADGVHLGQADLPVSEARLLLGPGRIIGLSTHNKAELHEGLACCADYLAFGPVFSGIHKEREEPIVGLDGLSAIPTTAESKPVFVNGGLNEHNVHEIFSRGLKRVVFMTALTLSEDLAAAVHTIKTLREHT